MRRVMSSLAVFCVLTGAGVAQQPASTPAFEAASVKPAIPGTRGFSVS